LEGHRCLKAGDTSPITEITAKGVRAGSDEYEADIIVFATGFDAVTGTLRSMDIRGKDGATKRSCRARRRRNVYAGSVKDMRKGIDTLVEAGNPEYLAWLSDQGMLPRAEMKRQLCMFGEQVLPHYRS
jgi:hypothetical protein